MRSEVDFGSSVPHSAFRTPHSISFADVNLYRATGSDPPWASSLFFC